MDRLSRGELRLIVASWPEDAPRGSVSRFCREHRVSRDWFYSVRKQSAEEGVPAVLLPRSRRPKTSPARTPEPVEELAVRVRARLAQEGWDHGPLSVRAELQRMGVAAPSRATLARIFVRAGVVVPEPRKRPRSSWIRFRYAAPNECWQMDATEWALADGTKVAIFQLTDDHSRLAIASLAARSENAEDALRVVMTGIARHGIPQRLLTDNGAALNPTRRGRRGLLPEAMKALGVNPISSTPGHPQTQGKNERGHSTLKRWLRARPAALDLAGLQQQLELFDDYYNTIRTHQSLDGLTPAASYAALPKAIEPTPPTPEDPDDPAARQVSRRIDPHGIARIDHCRYQLGAERGGTTCHAIIDAATVLIFDSTGTLIHSGPRHPAGTYIPNGKPRGFMTTHQPSAKS
jgi:putative transposase